MKKKIKLITLAAGEGLRLRDYSKKNNLPKPLISILNKSMIQWSVDSYAPFITQGLISRSDLYFVVLKEHNQNYSISDQLISMFGKQIKIIELPKLTRGPAETAYHASLKIKEKNYSVIFNDCDHYFSSNMFLKTTLSTDLTKISGIINVANTNSNKPEWSYVEMDNEGNLKSIKEKDITLAKNGAQGVIAAYYFSKVSTFKEEAKLMISENDKVGKKKQKEFFISKIYDRLIKKKHKFRVIKSGYAFPLGTPEQIKKFLKSYKKNFFYPEASTLIFDIDGVIFEHDKGFNSTKGKYTYPTNEITKNVNFLRDRYNLGDNIVLMTARPEIEKSNLLRELSQKKIPFTKLIMGLSGGPRILINDKKPLKKIKTALAIQTKRNQYYNFDKFFKKNKI